MVLSNYRDFIHIQPKCEFCGKDAEEVHHLTPRTCGGTNDEENLMSLCKHCHNLIHKKITPIGELIKFGREHHEIKKGELARLKKRVKQVNKEINKADRSADLKLKRAERKADEYKKYYSQYLSYKQDQDFWIREVVKLQDLLEEEKARCKKQIERNEEHFNIELNYLHRIRILEEQLEMQKV